ncbi:choline-sulfatase [Vreelandella subterranea]|uniref:Choline-sulfatase n=1 Tax=Vreelandella subterranea TaxID=416874 RepID=A0A1H9PAG7_9GAMM|nr:choline-sulfatase [Halomonas subterranea]SER44769.1 choline-sulfatase [Halomonas subterranea]
MTKPNVLVLMADQLNGTLFKDGPADFLHAPNLKKLAKRSVNFNNAYTPSYLCAPGRAAFMSSQLPSRTGVYDNAAEFPSSVPTWAHHLRRAGYSTCLSGKMHFVGPDQLHGFEKRLTTDVYPADFGWTPNYTRPGERIDWWYHNLGSVTGAGVAEISNQMEYDDEVAFHAEQKLYDLSRGHDERPWALCVSFTHPHDPYVARRQYWDLYNDCEYLEPQQGPVPFDELDPHSQRIFEANDYTKFNIQPQDVRNARQGYFANISYIDDKIGGVLDVLERTRMLDNTIIVVCADHGDMLGEKGLWFKMSPYEGSSRVPLMLSAPGIEPRNIEDPVSIIDINTTIADLVGIDLSSIAPYTDGQSLLPLTRGEKRDAPVYMEYAAEASYSPIVTIREGKWKFNYCEIDPPQLFDLEADPLEQHNLAAHPDYAEILADYQAKVHKRWDLKAFDADVRASQAQRLIVYEALRNGHYYPWDYQPLQDASERYMRNHMDLNEVEEAQRYPRGE